MLTQKTFISGMSALVKGYVGWQFNLNDTVQVNFWYAALKNLTDEQFNWVIKNYYAHHKKPPACVSDLTDVIVDNYYNRARIKPEGASKSRYVHDGDFLLTNSMSFGRPYILRTEGCIHDGWLVISQPVPVFDQDYLYWLLSSQLAYMQFAEVASGGVVKNLNSDKVANAVFPVPPIEEQKRIVERLETLLPLCDELLSDT